MTSPQGSEQGSGQGSGHFESYSIEPGVRRNLFGSQERNVNTQRGNRQSIHASMLEAERNNIEVIAEVYPNNDLPDELPEGFVADSTRQNVNENPGAGTQNRNSTVRNGGIQQDDLDRIDEIPEDEENAQRDENQTNFSTPPAFFRRPHFRNSYNDNFSMQANPDLEQDNTKFDNNEEANYTNLYEKMFELQQQNRKLRMEKGNIEKERNEFRELLEEALEVDDNRNLPRNPVNVSNNNLPRNQVNVSKHLDLKSALQMVRNFSGDNSDKLDCFLKSVATARKLIHPELEEFLLEAIMGSKLEGNAMKQLKYRSITSYEQLKTELESLFGKAKNLFGLQVEFSKLQQRDNEDIIRFVNRTEEVTVDYLNGLLGLHPEFTEREKLAAKTVLGSMAKIVFEQGLRGQLQILVRANHFKTLHEACAGAVELDKTISGGRIKSAGVPAQNRNSVGGNRATMGRQSIGNCFNCGKLGHLAKDCHTEVGKRKSLPVASDRRSIHSYGNICKYCRYAGHDMQDCHKLKKKMGLPPSAKIQITNDNQNKVGQEKPKNGGKWNGNNTNGGRKNNDTKTNDQEKNNAVLPVGAYQIMMIQAEEKEIISNEAKLIIPAEPSAMKTQILLAAEEMKNPTLFLTDSGAKASLIKINKLSEKATIIPGYRVLRGISDQDVATLGEVIIYLKIGEEIIGHKFQVVPENFPCIGGILGEDFLASPSLKVKTLHGKELVINGHRLELFTDKEPTKIPARSEILIQVPTISKKEGIVQKKEVKKGIFLGECLTKPINGMAYVCIINTNCTDEYVNLPTIKLHELASEINIMTMVDKKEKKEIKDRIKLLRENLRVEHLNNDEKSSLMEILEEFNSIVQLPGDAPGVTNHLEHEINLKPGTVPINVRPHRLPQSQEGEVDRQVKEMLENGVVRPSKSQWNAPLLVVPKKMDASGKVKFRVVVDFRRLNEVTAGDSFPLPNIADILDRLGNAKYFSTLDLASGFHQIPVREEDKCKTAFSTPYGHYEFNRMPFGVKGGPASFQRLMNSVLAGIQGLRCFVYLDDIVIFGASLEEHNKRLIEVFLRLKEANLRLQPDKCNFLRKEVVYLGHIITKDGIKADPSKIEAVVNFPAPQNEKEIMSFLGLAGYYRKFIKDFSKIAKPLSELLKKDVTWSWGEKEQIAFADLKEVLTTAPILQYPDFEKPFLLTTDASNKAIGAVLSQGEIGKDLPISYASRTLNKAEINYSTIERELLAVVWGVKHYRPYLYGRKFIVVTDHRPLRWIFNVKDPGSRLMHWRILLEEYEYEVVHKPGKQNTNADALSRINVVTRAQTRTETDASGQWVSGNGVITPADNEISSILQEYHNTPIAGHPGVKRMYAKLQQKYHWTGMKSDVEKFVATCEECQLNKLGKATKVPMIIGETPEEAFEQCAMDVVGPLPVTEAGNKYILTFQDALTKFSRAIPIPDQEANTIGRAFAEKIICEFGIPQKLLTDQGPNFVGQIFKNVCRLLKIKKIQTTAYHPQTNGIVERSHRTLAEYLRGFIQEDQTDWDTWLPYAMFAYNTTPHTATKMTPFELVFGRQAELPTAVKQPPRLTYCYDDFAQELRERLRAAHQEAKEALDTGKEKSKIQYDKNAESMEFEVGDKVLLKNNVLRRGRSKKLTQPWIGPYEITEKNSDVNYTIRYGNKQKTQRVHINRLRPFIEA